MLLTKFKRLSLTKSYKAVCTSVHINKNPQYSHQYNFSTSSALGNTDPYYMLGVQKTADFKEIKKAFFKLANEYHPDKNSSHDAKIKFQKAKQAFEMIKMQKGLMKPQNFVESTPHDSARPNSSQFMSDEDEQYHPGQRDYRVWQQKAQAKKDQSEEYQRFHTSFKTIHDINDIRIKVEEGDMRDVTEDRFGLSKMRKKLKFMSEGSLMFLAIGAIGIGWIIFSLRDGTDQVSRSERKGAVVAENQIKREKAKRLSQSNTANREGNSSGGSITSSKSSIYEVGEGSKRGLNDRKISSQVGRIREDIAYEDEENQI